MFLVTTKTTSRTTAHWHTTLHAAHTHYQNQIPGATVYLSEVPDLENLTMWELDKYAAELAPQVPNTGTTLLVDSFRKAAQYGFSIYF